MSESRRPFNSQTRQVLNDSEQGVSVREFDSAETLFEDLAFDSDGRDPLPNAPPRFPTP